MKVKVSTIAFSKNQALVSLLQQHFPDAEVNNKGIRMNDDDLVDFFSDADAVIVGLEKITPELLNKLPRLKMIAKYGVGLDNVDMTACSDRGIRIGWTGGVNKRSVAEMALGFMLALIRNLYSTSNQMKQMVWNKSGGFQLSGKTVGIIGLGNIGKELVALLKPFGCNIIVNDIADISLFAAENELKIVSKSELISSADLISIHTPANTNTLNLFTLIEFKMMKPTAFIINTARGGIINEGDLKIALKDRLIAGAALDVYEPEPPIDRELLEMENVICTPHTGGNAAEAVFAMGESAINHLLRFKNEIIKQ
jgi:phosphoglycerate dehydrogenase-like enzyme